jgi:hypothetical protein
METCEKCGAQSDKVKAVETDSGVELLKGQKICYPCLVEYLITEQPETVPADVHKAVAIIGGLSKLREVTTRLSKDRGDTDARAKAAQYN